jgi:hypothetical protein
MSVLRLSPKHAMAPGRIAKEWECRSDPVENHAVLDTF